MRFAVLSDIHANLDALQAVLDDVSQQNVERILHLGDLVGYGPNPEGVIELVRDKGIASVLGNHEHAMLRDRAKKWFNSSSRKAVDIAASMLSPQTLAYLKTLPTSIVFDQFRFVHGFPRENAFLYLVALDNARLERAFATMKEIICFVGHTHLLEWVSWDKGVVDRDVLELGTMKLDRSKKYILNVGSVGQARDDFDNRAKYAVFDCEAWSVEVRAVTYDWKSVARRIRELGIPETYARRLSGPGRL